MARICDYSKWNNIDAGDDEEPAGPEDTSGSTDARFWSLLGDVRSAKVRWTLQKWGGFKYLDVSVPVGVHIWPILQHSSHEAAQLRLKMPILQIVGNPQTELRDNIFHGDLESINSFLYSRSLFAPRGSRLFPEDENALNRVLELEQDLEKDLLPLTQKIYWHIVLSSTALAMKTYVRNIPQPSHRVICQILAPIIVPVLHRLLAFKSHNDLQDAYVQIYNTFDMLYQIWMRPHMTEHVDQCLPKSTRSLLYERQTPMAADVSLAASAAVLLLAAGDADVAPAVALALPLPTLGELSPRGSSHCDPDLVLIANHARKLRTHPIGQLALRLLRDTSALGIFDPKSAKRTTIVPAKYSQDAYPAWARHLDRLGLYLAACSTFNIVLCISVVALLGVQTAMFARSISWTHLLISGWAIGSCMFILSLVAVRLLFIRSRKENQRAMAQGLYWLCVSTCFIVLPEKWVTLVDKRLGNVTLGRLA